MLQLAERLGRARGRRNSLPIPAGFGQAAPCVGTSSIGWLTTMRWEEAARDLGGCLAAGPNRAHVPARTHSEGRSKRHALSWVIAESWNRRQMTVAITSNPVATEKPGFLRSTSRTCASLVVGWILCNAPAFTYHNAPDDKSALAGSSKATSKAR
jgi:hypothetical protein